VNTCIPTITRQRLRELLANVNHATPVGFIALTDANARKTGNPFGRVFSLTKVNAFVGADYEASVNRRREKEGILAAFQASSRANGTERLGPALARKIVNGEERFYLPAQIQHSRPPLYLVNRPHGLGRTILAAIPKDRVAPFLPSPRTLTNQGVAQPVVYRDYALSSITRINIDGQTYRVRT